MHAHASAAPLSAALRVILIEDQSLVAEGIASILRQIPGLVVLRAFSSASAALQDEQTVRSADLALIDFHLGAREEEKHLREFHDRFGHLRFVWLSGAVSAASLIQIDTLRFHGFVHKDDPSPHLVEAVRTVMSGRVYHSPTAQRLLREVARSPLSIPKILSPREQEILGLIGEGRTNEEIAARVALSPATVQTHRRNIMGKLGLRTSVALQAYAQQNGFIGGSPATR